MVSWKLNALRFGGDYTLLAHQLTFDEPGSLGYTRKICFEPNKNIISPAVSHPNCLASDVRGHGGGGKHSCGFPVFSEGLWRFPGEANLSGDVNFVEKIPINY